MALFNVRQLNERASSEIRKSSGYLFTGSKVFSALNESVEKQLDNPLSTQYDIFLSHSSKDANQVFGLKLELEDLGYTVYIDWVEDKQLNRQSVTKETAKILKERMRNSATLIYAFSENGSHSKWMPWELGYFDALKGTAAVLPILNEESSSEAYAGTEFVSLYNYIVKTGQVLFVHENEKKFVDYSAWVNGKKP